jgi:hypothetical protein
MNRKGFRVRLLKEYGAATYLRARGILRLRPNRCNLRVMLWPRDQDSAGVYLQGC